jgi:hypothetical protein
VYETYVVTEESQEVFWPFFLLDLNIINGIGGQTIQFDNLRWDEDGRQVKWY